MSDPVASFRRDNNEGGPRSEGINNGFSTDSVKQSNKNKKQKIDSNSDAPSTSKEYKPPNNPSISESSREQKRKLILDGMDVKNTKEPKPSAITKKNAEKDDSSNKYIIAGAVKQSPIDKQHEGHEAFEVTHPTSGEQKTPPISVSSNGSRHVLHLGIFPPSKDMQLVLDFSYNRDSEDIKSNITDEDQTYNKCRSNATKRKGSEESHSLEKCMKKIANDIEELKRNDIEELKRNQQIQGQQNIGFSKIMASLESASQKERETSIRHSQRLDTLEENVAYKDLPMGELVYPEGEGFQPVQEEGAPDDGAVEVQPVQEEGAPDDEEVNIQ